MENTQISLIDRYRGTMVGVLCGDALGAPYETWPGVAIRMDVERRGGLVLFDYDDPFEKDGRFPAGRPTDDSEMTAALAEYYITDGSIEDLYALFRRCVVDKQSFLCDLPAYGFGGTTRRALKEATYAEALARPDAKPAIPSNGALMRSAPVALRFCGASAMDLMRATRIQAMLTHQHSDAIMPAVLYVAILDRLLAGKSYQEAAQSVAAYFRTAPAFDEDLYRLFAFPPERPVVPPGLAGGARLTLRIAHWALATSSSFEEGITNAITIGRDVDTYGAVAGGWLGALYGIDAIPAKWRDGLLGGTRMEELAQGLYDARHAS